MNVENDSKFFNDAVSREQADHWKAAIQKELDSLDKNKIWTLVRKEILTSRLVLRTKTEQNGVIRKKARLMICGFEDWNAYDRTET